MADQTASATAATDVTFDVSTGEPVDLDLDTQHLIETPWRVGRWLKMVVHAQRDAAAGLRDKPIGVMLTPALARLVVDQQNALHSAAPWGTASDADTATADPVI